MLFTKKVSQFQAYRVDFKKSFYLIIMFRFPILKILQLNNILHLAVSDGLIPAG